MTYTLHGIPGLIVFLLAILAAVEILVDVETWVEERISIDLNPLWHFIPRRFKVRVRWDRPGATVRMDDGREGSVLIVEEGVDDALPIALVQPFDEDDTADQLYPEWHISASLTPVPRPSIREMLHALRSQAGGGS